jgi:hypothetical protein
MDADKLVRIAWPAAILAGISFVAYLLFKRRSFVSGITEGVSGGLSRGASALWIGVTEKEKAAATARAVSEMQSVSDRTQALLRDPNSASRFLDSIGFPIGYIRDAWNAPLERQFIRWAWRTAGADISKLSIGGNETDDMNYIRAQARQLGFVALKGDGFPA